MYHPLVNIFIILILLALAGIFAGLTLALFSLKLSDLERKMRGGNEQARKVYKIRQQGNLLLCTLLLGNVASYTGMTIFLDSLTSGVVAGVVATSLIFIFAEILPQAVFPRYALALGAKLNWLVWGTIFLFYPISAPIAWVLNRLLGKETPVLWNKKELGEIIKYHEDVGDGIIDEDEERIILGALTFSELRVKDIMIPREEVFYLQPQTIIDEQVTQTIKNKGFSRIPVYDPVEKTLTGLLYTKNLIGIMPKETVGCLCSKSGLIRVKESMLLDNLLNLLIQKRIHLALVVNHTGEFSGVVTLEDIMEEILKTELEEKNEP